MTFVLIVLALLALAATLIVPPSDIVKLAAAR